MGAVAAGAVAFAALLVIAAAMVWQATRRRNDGVAIYVLDEAVEFVLAALEPEVATRVGEDGVRRILEWSNHHSQVVVARRGPPVVGGPEALDYVAERAAASGEGYPTEDVAAVLTAETAYLVAIGAVGERVEEEPA